MPLGLLTKLHSHMGPLGCGFLLDFDFASSYALCAILYLLFACCLVRRQAGNKTLPLTFCLVPVPVPVAMVWALWSRLPWNGEMLMHYIVIDGKPPS